MRCFKGEKDSSIRQRQRQKGKKTMKIITIAETKCGDKPTIYATEIADTNKGFTYTIQPITH